jgi:double-stranded uracil-DNA glycosylase
MVTCFPPLASPDAKVLILGSFPGKESLRKQEYYAHPRNTFWFIIRSLFHLEDALSYEERAQVLRSRRLALWDVVSSCRRVGSLDSSIDNTTIQVNDFKTFFREYKDIERVFFNGLKAEKEYQRRVLPEASSFCRALQYHRLPSTSPAMAMLTRDEKLARWARVLDKLS